MKKCFALVTLMSLSIPAFADINDKDVQEYAKINNVSNQEASRALNIEANKEQPRTSIQKIMMICYTFDAENKRFALDVTKITGSIIIFFLLVFIVVFLLKPKKK